MSVTDPRNENGVAQRCTRFENGPALGESGYSFETATPTMIMTSQRLQRCSFGTLQLKLLPLDCLRSPELGRCYGASWASTYLKESRLSRFLSRSKIATQPMIRHVIPIMSMMRIVPSKKC